MDSVHLRRFVRVLK